MNFKMKMNEYGWNEYFNTCWEKIYGIKWSDADETLVEHCPARIVSDHGKKMKLVTPYGEVLGTRHANEQILEQQMAAGDWVGVMMINGYTEAIIQNVLPRQTKFSRAAAGIEVKEQVVAANVDTIFLIQSLNKDFNMKRLDRYLVGAWESGALPVVVLTKADLCDDFEAKKAKVEDAAPGVEVHVVSNLTGEGIESLRKYFSVGKTVALLGSSGVGKSTLVNSLMGEIVLKTQDIREGDSKGRHTTTHRELVKLSCGGMVLDTPGMRTLALWEADEGMEKQFGDIEELIKTCRFNNCTHDNEPGCGIRKALNQGVIDAVKWESWKKLQKEMRFLDAKKSHKIRSMEKQSVKKYARPMKSKTVARDY